MTKPDRGRHTVHDVARKAKVSPMTVSNFVNGKHHTMSESTRKRVEAAVRALNYRPQTAGRNLRYSKSFSIGLLIVDENPHFLSDGYTTQVTSGLGNAVNARGFSLQIEGVRRERFEASTLLSHRRTDALCVILSGDDATREHLLESVAGAQQPLIVLLEATDSPLDDTCCVVQKDRAGARQLAQHVLAKEARKLLICRHGLSNWKAVDERLAGIAEAVAPLGRDVTLETVLCGDGSFEAAQNAIADAIDEGGRPDAVMAMSDQIGIAALKLLRARDIDVPGDVMITGFNAFEFRDYAELTLTTVRSPGYELGVRAGEALIDRLETGSFTETLIELPVELLIGETT